MARTSPRERPDQETILWPIRKECPACGLPMRVRYENRRLAPLLREVADADSGVVSDGQTSIRRAVERALPGVPHQLCHFHFLREAARPVFEADRQAKKTLKKHIRGVRRIERAVEDVTDPQAEVVRGYCAAVRSAITDDGHPPLAASGLKLKGRLEAVADSLDRVAEKGRRRSLSRCET